MKEVNKTPKIAIIVLNWNGWQDTVECLESLSQIEYQNFNITVVDNGSTDNSIEQIKAWASGKLRIKIIKLKHNIGYAKGNNAGIRDVLSDPGVRYILILNNDTIVSPDFLSCLAEILNKEKNVALAGPKLIDYKTGKYWQSPLKNRLNLLTYLLFSTPIYWMFYRTLLHNFFKVKEEKPVKVYMVAGCAMFFRADILRDIGMFDENSFLYWEEFIIAEKLRERGLLTYFVPQSIIRHKLGAATQKMDPAEKTIAKLQSEAYFQSNYLKMPWLQRFIIKTVELCIYFLLAVVSGSYRQKFGEIAHIIFYGKA